MASKRIKNRAYWVAVKATADPERKSGLCPGRSLFAKAVKGAPDRVILPELEALEAKYGTHKPYADLANSRFWRARRVVDVIRDGFGPYTKEEIKTLFPLKGA